MSASLEIAFAPLATAQDIVVRLQASRKSQKRREA
jgi:hypothetical protein